MELQEEISYLRQHMAIGLKRLGELEKLHLKTLNFEILDPSKMSEFICNVIDEANYDIFSKSRKRPIVAARYTIMYIVKDHFKTNVGLKELAQIVGLKDHSMAHHGLEQATFFISQSDEIFMVAYHKIKPIFDKYFNTEAEK